MNFFSKDALENVPRNKIQTSINDVQKFYETALGSILTDTKNILKNHNIPDNVISEVTNLFTQLKNVM